jgi:hypothetical protein
MMSTAAIKTALAAIISTITGIPIANVVWRGSFQERSMVIGTRAVLYMNSKVGIGVDETRQDVSPVRIEDQASVVQCGQRRITWSILIETQQLNASQDAGELMDLVRISLRKPSVLAAINAAGFAINSFAGTTNTDFLSGGRTVTQAMLDVYLNSADNDADTGDGSGDWIGEAIIDSDTANDAAGPVSPQLHIDVDERP